MNSAPSPSFLFDLDGTLVDSVYQHVLAWHEALQSCSIDLPVWRIHRRIGMSGGLFTKALLESRMPVIYGDGRQSRDFTYIDNVVDANLKALTVRGLRGQVVNVATGRRTDLLTLLRLLAAEIGRPARARHLAPRKGDVRHSVADISAARRLLGYSPRVGFETGIRRTVEWYRGVRR